MSLTGGKSQNKQVSSQTNRLDPYMEELRKKFGVAADAAAGSPPPTIDPSVMEAMRMLTGVGNLGLGATKILSGDPSAISAQMNPYQQQVIGALTGEFDRMRDKSVTGIKQRAAAAGGYGGTRHGVAEGVALGEIANAQGAQTSQLLKAGYDDIMSRALSTVNLGMGAASGLAGLGQYVTGFNADNDPAMRRFNILGQSMGLTPYTVNSKGRSTSTTRSAQGQIDLGTPFKFFGK